MPLYNILKNPSPYAHSIKAKLNIYSTSHRPGRNFTKNIICVNQSPHSSLQRKLCNDDFRAVRHAYDKNETRLGVNDTQHENNTPMISENEKNELNRYKELCENAFFTNNEMPRYDIICDLKDFEESVFPLILNAANTDKPNMISYCTDADDIAQQLVNCPAGQKQFIYYDGCHAIYVDAFKDYENNISLITIDSMETSGRHTPDDDIARAIFAKDTIKDGQLSMLNLQTNIQKSDIGCKYFSMAFAKQAAKDPYLIPQHQLNIAGVKSGMRNLRHLLSVKDSQKLLGAAYYKHSHSSTRIKEMPIKKQEEIISSKGSLLQRHLQFRVKKTIDNHDINFSQSINIFRKKQIEKAVESINSDKI